MSSSWGERSEIRSERTSLIAFLYWGLFNLFTFYFTKKEYGKSRHLSSDEKFPETSLTQFLSPRTPSIAQLSRVSCKNGSAKALLLEQEARVQMWSEFDLESEVTTLVTTRVKNVLNTL